MHEVTEYYADVYYNAGNGERSHADFSAGKLNISKGMINKLSREFALKSEQEYKTLFADML